MKSSIEAFKVFNWSILSLQLKYLYLKSSIEVINHFTTFTGGWVGCLKMEIRLSQPQLKLKLSWVELSWQKCCPKNCRSTNFGVQKNQSLQKIGTKKSGQNLVSNSWSIPNMPMFPGQMLRGQMSLWQLASVKDYPSIFPVVVVMVKPNFRLC